MNDQQTKLHATLTAVLKQEHPTIYLSAEFVTGRNLPTTWASAYAIIEGSLVKLWSVDDMKVRRKDNEYYWHHNGWGTPHSFVIAEAIGDAVGIENLDSLVSVRCL
tara:strand:+ start:981 stop:1298 length:318 start_codon:yes stop_codon:yes gene_type:complete